MGKSQLTTRFVEMADGSVESADERVDPSLPCVLINLEAERQRLPERYPALEGPSIGTLLYAVERAICEELGSLAEEAFAEFRDVLARILDLVDKSDQMRSNREQEGKSLTEQQIAGLESAVGLVTGLVGVKVDPHSAVAVGVAGRGLMGWLRRGQPELRAGVEQREIDLALDPERVLVAAFADGLYAISKKSRLVIGIDTAEIAEFSLSAIREVATQAGSKVVWLIAGRFDTPAESGYEKSTVAKFQRAVSHDRLVSIAISAFDKELQARFLESRTGIAIEEKELARLDRVTRGIPLALQLVVDMIREGLPLEEIDRSIGVGGNPNRLIKELTERFLHHAEQVGRIPNPRKSDLPAIFGLAVDDTAEAGKIIGYEMQRRILASLLDVEPEALSDYLRDLAERHDFVTAATGRVHQEVASVFSEHMLGSDQRLRYADMHERAIVVIREELGSRYASVKTGERLTDARWRVLVAALLRHEFWISNWRGVNALAAVWPQATILMPSFAQSLREIAKQFYPTCTEAEQKLLRGIPHEQAAADMRRADLAGEPGIPVGTDDDSQRFWQMLRGLDQDPELSAPQTVRDCLGELISAREEAGGIGWDKAVLHIQEADRLVGSDDETLSRAIATIAQKTASGLHFASAASGKTGGILSAAQIAVKRNPDNAEARGLAAVGQWFAHDYDAALIEHDKCIELDPDDAFKHHCKSITLSGKGAHDEALVADLKAHELDPKSSTYLASIAFLLRRVGKFDEAREKVDLAMSVSPKSPDSLNALARLRLDTGEYGAALDAADEAVDRKRSGASATTYHITRAMCLIELDRLDDALDAIQVACDLNATSVAPRTDKGMLLAFKGQPEEALAALDEAIGIDGEEDEAWFWRGVTQRALLSQEKESIESFKTAALSRCLWGHPLRRAEMRALSLAAAGDLSVGLKEMSAVTEPAQAWVYQRHMYDLLRRAPFEGLGEIERFVQRVEVPTP